MTDQRLGQVRYSLVCKPSGGVLDDILVTRVEKDRFDLVVNASNREKLLDWFAAHHSMANATLTDHTEATAMMAVQGPQAVELVSKLAATELTTLRYYNAQADVEVAGVECSVSRTGYTGEDGFELVCKADNAQHVWQTLVNAGAKPCGLAARDTLRLEAGMPLYGHELSESIHPIQAGLGFAVSFKNEQGDSRDFIGYEALLTAKQERQAPIRIGLQTEGRRAPREGYAVLCDGQRCGEVTSGALSPSLESPIAMAYVKPQAVTPDTPLTVDIRGTKNLAQIVPLPFYKRT